MWIANNRQISDSWNNMIKGAMNCGAVGGFGEGEVNSSSYGFIFITHCNARCVYTSVQTVSYSSHIALYSTHIASYSSHIAMLGVFTQECK